MTIEARLSSIYAAAHQDLPAQAGDFAQHADVLGGALGPLTANAEAAGAYQTASDTGRLGEELFHRLRIMVRTLNDSAVGLARIADDFATTDEQAQQWLAQHQGWVEDHPGMGDRPDTPALPQLPDAARLP